MPALNREKKADLLTLCDNLGLVASENSKIADLIKLENQSGPMKILQRSY